MKIQQSSLQSQYALLDQLSDGFIICDVNKPGYPIEYVSDGFCAFTGYAREEILGVNCNFLQSKGTEKKNDSNHS
jgi:hypothetical protein